MSARMTCIERCGRELAALDEGGFAIVVVRSESDQDIRDVVETYVHRDDAPRAEALSVTYDPRRERTLLERSFVMREVTAYGTLKRLGFGGAFTMQDAPAAGESRLVDEYGDSSLLGFLAKAADPSDGFEQAPILLFVPSPTYLETPFADGTRGAVDADGRQIIHLLKQLANTKRRGGNRTLVVIGARPEETIRALDNEAYILDVPLPDDDEVERVVRDVYERNAEPPVAPIAPFIMSELIAQLRGFRRDRIVTTLQVAFARYRNPLENGAEQLLGDIRDAKLQLLKKTPGLTLRAPHGDTPGGLGNLIKWVESKSAVMTYGNEARRSSVSLPRGIIAAGVPGTGKSFAADWIARTLSRGGSPLPLLQLDMGSIMGRYQGESEERFSAALRLAESMSPCVLFIDELDKSFSGVGTGGENNASLDRIFGRLLGWLQDQERSETAVFLFATANHMEKLPSEFLRLGRFDEKFFFFMPTGAECADIVCKHLAKHAPMIDGGHPGGADGLVDELRQTVVPAFLAAAIRRGKYLTGADIAAVVNETFQELFTERVNELPPHHIREALSADAGRLLRAPLSEVSDMLVRKLADTHVYGDTNLADVAWYWIWAQRNRPRSASDRRPVLDHGEYRRASGRFNRIGSTNVADLDRLDARKYRARLAEALRSVRERDYEDGSLNQIQSSYDIALGLGLASEIFHVVSGRG